MEIPFLPKLEGYVIWNQKTGLFSSGGSCPKLRNKGKIWRTLGHVKNHLHVVMPYDPAKAGRHIWLDKWEYPDPVYKDCVIVNIADGFPVNFDIYDWCREKRAEFIKPYQLKNLKAMG